MKLSERSFGLSMAVVCGLLAGYGLWRGWETTAWGFTLLALGLLIPALIRPTLLRAPRDLWLHLAQLLGWVNTRVFLTAFFGLVLTPVGLVLRLGGWDPLRRQRRRDGSGWLPYPERLKDTKHYEHMY